MNIRKITSLICCFALTGFTAQSFAFSNQDAAITATETIAESCSLSAGTEGLTQTILETGGSDQTTVFGTFTTSCNSASGFTYAIKNDDDTCAFVNGSSTVYWSFSTGTGTVATFSGTPSGTISNSSNLAVSDQCPDDTGGFISIHSVSAGTVYNAVSVDLKPDVSGAGAANLLEGTYSDAVTLRLADV
ncbi:MULTISPECIES: hypothetical protein [Cysteiniphilum]|uniref:Spore coat protein U domain-containing protein n=1 Tax=Cysteiniphilum litorale TaxID=2056700 RepID=A0A8J3E7Y7_9GAMM|nr:MULTISPECIES: hypothetical protein [Cysteiniphilum]WHN66433.1 hypothetical protein NYP54_04165 [Cysteiniphilum sp. QT6929]GGF93920.1 hypothetical protein GCM10010995_08950 [Cysteiniphilum litorale]